MARMHVSPPPVQVTLAPSRIERAWVVGLALSTAFVAFALPLDAWLRGVLSCSPFAWALWRLRTARRVACVSVGLDRRVHVAMADGAVVEGRVLSASYVGAAVTTIVWRRQGSRVARALWLVGDMLPRADFRRLRVALRYGQSAAAHDASARNHA